MSEDFYIKLPMKEKNEHQMGQIFWVPSPMTVDSTYTLRIGSWKAGIDISQAKLEVQRVRLASLGNHVAQEKVDMNRMVLPEVNLDSSEDLIVNKVKRRPAALIYRDCFNMRKFSAGTHKGPNRHIFAPIYSLRKEEHAGKDYDETFIEKVATGAYPNILFLPAYGTLLKNDSMLVLTEMFSVAMHAMETTEYCIEPISFGAQLETFNEYLMHEAEDLSNVLYESMH